MRVFHSAALIISLTFCLAALAAPPELSSTSQPSRAQAIDRVKKAVIFFKEKGKEKAIEEFNHANSPFNQGGMYMFGMILDEVGTQPIHPNLKTRGKAMGNLRDSDGKLLIRELNAVCAEKGSGWVEYKWLNKSSNQIELKSSYVEKVGDMCIGTGIFTPK